MLHTENVSNPEILQKLTGQYYTHNLIVDHITNHIMDQYGKQWSKMTEISICDPFAGDGRLVVSFLKEFAQRYSHPVKFKIYLWDINDEGLQKVEQGISTLIGERLAIETDLQCIDTFVFADGKEDLFDIVLSNPPWAMLKPDQRELNQLDDCSKRTYISELKQYDKQITKIYPTSQPKRKFAGWGTNLSRVGLEVCANLVKDSGVIGIVLPASFMADNQSENLRKDFLSSFSLDKVFHYPAEAKLFGKADVQSIAMCGKKVPSKFPMGLNISRFSVKEKCVSENELIISESYLKNNEHSIPLTLSKDAFTVQHRLFEDFDLFKSYEGDAAFNLWAGREVDETGINKYLIDGTNEGRLFLKGKIVERYGFKEEPSKYFYKKDYVWPRSSSHRKIVWRDISRPSQKRRLIATIAEINTIAGNSLGVAYFRDSDDQALYSLLGLMSSSVFEFQLRNYLATGHVSLSALRKVRVPSLEAIRNCAKLAKLAMLQMESQNTEDDFTIDAFVAKNLYQLNLNEYVAVLESFDKINDYERKKYIAAFKATISTSVKKESRNLYTIPNHLSARLSELDLQMVAAVPEGGNWKNIPTSIPSKRLEQIRESYARGEGSRSTYYGRLTKSKPSYTINTYFNRPGNGCHIHYSQQRVISQREAARFQSFPDSFEFIGSQTAINTQIGNAVPPLLAYQIANLLTETLGEKGEYVDLFSGAGGLGLGFKWAGWKPIIANDIERRFLETYSHNVHKKVLHGSISDPEIVSELIDYVESHRSPDKQLWILGGPPCQGFSTAGSKRTMTDPRNLLFWDYKNVLELIKPNGFIFENVAGLLNMKKGSVFQEVKRAFSSVMPSLTGWVLNSEEYAIPQRRKRVFLIGNAEQRFEVKHPKPLTFLQDCKNLFSDRKTAISCEEAINDLPPLDPGENGSDKQYRTAPKSIYQKLMRGEISPSEYLDKFIND